MPEILLIKSEQIVLQIRPIAVVLWYARGNVEMHSFVTHLCTDCCTNMNADISSSVHDE